jgi:phosphate transport system substrate-binding protein
MKKTTLIFVLCLMMIHGMTEARERIRIVGSSAILPFVQTVAERFSLTWGYPAPSLELTGTGNGFRLFSRGVGYEHPDINVASRPITVNEFKRCQANGVTAITEIIVGLDAIIWANSSMTKQTSFTPEQLFAGLAAEVPVGGVIAPNPVTRWEQIDASLPASAIKVMGPPPTSATYYGFLELIMRRGCKGFLGIGDLDEERRYRICGTVRKDGAYLPGLKDEFALFEWLVNHPRGFGVTTFALLVQNPGVIAANPIDGVFPTTETISNRSYPLSRAIFLYVKTKHVDAIKGLQQFLYEFTSERAIGPDGYLVEKGFTPLDDRGRNLARDRAFGLMTINAVDADGNPW